jgi:hypothetical protein
MYVCMYVCMYVLMYVCFVYSNVSGTLYAVLHNSMCLITKLLPAIYLCSFLTSHNDPTVVPHFINVTTELPLLSVAGPAQSAQQTGCAVDDIA